MASSNERQSDDVTGNPGSEGAIFSTTFPIFTAFAAIRGLVVAAIFLAWRSLRRSLSSSFLRFRYSSAGAGSCDEVASKRTARDKGNSESQLGQLAKSPGCFHKTEMTDIPPPVKVTSIQRLTLTRFRDPGACGQRLSQTVWPCSTGQ